MKLSTTCSLSLGTGLGTSGNRRQEVDRALAQGARNPLAAERLASRISSGQVSFGGISLTIFAEQNPDAAFQAAVKVLPSVPTERHPDIFRMMGKATTDSRLAEASSVLNALESPRDRIAALRMAFNIREGVRNVDFPVPGRLIGSPPLESGPLAGVTVDLDTQVREYLEAMGWDTQTGAPTEATLRRLGLDFVADEICTGG